MAQAVASETNVTVAPRVTVLMAVYNGATWLDEAVESVLSQDLRDLEFVIVDDASTDATPEILARWAAGDPRVAVVRNEANRGQAASLSSGLQLARGAYVARQDADDLSEPGRLTAEADLLDARPDVVMVSTNYHVIDGEGRVLRSDDRARPQAIVEYFLHFSNVIGGHSQVMFRRDQAIAAGGYDPAFRFAEDYDLWSRLTERGGIVILPIYAMRYRLHAGAATAGATREMQEVSARVVHRTLPRLLGRPVTEAESIAVRMVSGARLALVTGPSGPMIATAHSIYAEGFGVAVARGLGSAMLDEIRRLTARTFGRTALVLLISRRDLRGALAGLAFAMRWGVGSALAGFLSAFWTVLLVKWHRA